jgi:RNA-directed DNA polymerase
VSEGASESVIDAPQETSQETSQVRGAAVVFIFVTNHPSLWWFFNKVKRLWLASLKRRSQTARLSWERFIQFVARFFPPIRTIHPLPCHRFDARTRGRSPVR